MTIRDTLGTLIIPGTVPTGNLLWVDQVSGINALASRGRMTVPFKTLLAAKAAAKSGDTIVVMPGTYNENDLAMNGVNWHFLTGAILHYSGTGVALFDTTTTGACSFKVTGNGVFLSDLGGGFALLNSADDLTLEFDRIETAGTAIFGYQGALRGSGNEIKSTGDIAVFLGQTPESHLNVNRIVATASIALYIDGAITSSLIRVHAGFISSTGSYALYFANGTAYIDAFELSSNAADTVNYNCSNNDPLHLRVARIINTSASGASVSIGSGSGTGSGAIRLYGCALYSKNGNFSISSASPKDVLCLEQSVIKKGSSNVTARIFTFVDVTANPNVGDL